MHQTASLLAVFLVVVAGCGSERVVGEQQQSSGTLTIVREWGPSIGQGDTLIVGDFAAFSVMRADSTLPPGPWEWSVSDTTVAAIDAQYGFGMTVRAVRAGRATVTVKHAEQTGSYGLVVRNERASDTAVAYVQPGWADTLRDQVGDTLLMGFYVYDARNHQVHNRPYTLTVSDSTAMEQVSSWEYGGVFRALKPGIFTFTLRIEGKQASSPVVITASASP